MSDFILNHEAALRLGFFLGLLGLFIVAEALWPRRDRVQSRLSRWRTNFGLVIVDTLVMRFALPIVAVGAAAWAAGAGWGLFNLNDFPIWLEIILAMIILDGLIYAQHVALHHVPIFWRFHKVHHADRDLDVTSGARFHPVEIIGSMAFKIACVTLLGAPVIAVILFEIILNGCALFNHANLRLPVRFDQSLRKILVTPDMHRVHHSTVMQETNSNFGFSLSIWDHIFRTYKAQPAGGHEDMTIGLSEHQTDKPAQLLWSLRFPFLRPTKQE